MNQFLSNHKKIGKWMFKGNFRVIFSKSYKIDSENKITSFGIHKEKFKLFNAEMMQRVFFRKLREIL